MSNGYEKYTKMKLFETLTKLDLGKCLLAYLIKIFNLMSVYFDMLIMLFQIGPGAPVLFWT